MKKLIAAISVVALFATACNKSDVPGPYSTNTPCTEDNLRRDMRDRKPAQSLKMRPVDENNRVEINRIMKDPVTGTERVFGDTIMLAVPARNPSKRPVDKLPV